MLRELSAASAEFLVVGAYALASHGFPRATGDLNLWVRPEPVNAKRVFQALIRFGAPTHGLNEADLSRPRVVYQLGLAPSRIDILTSIDGIEFEEAWNASRALVIEGISVKVLSREHLIRNKRATGRPKAFADVAWLESQSSDTSPSKS